MDTEMTFRPMRRFKQQITDDECVAILRSAYRGTLAVIGDGGYPYALPINFVYHEGKIYFHCAMSGHKLDAVRQCEKASFCVISEPCKEEDSWWYHVTSVICFGKICEINDPEQKDRLLRTLGTKYFPEGYDIDADMRKNSSQAIVLEFSIDHMTGKKVREK